jgi:hypothetical protein
MIVEMEYESPPPSPVPSPPREPSPVPDTPEKDSPKQEKNSVKPAQNTERRRKRTRKLVPKTFMDEDGYMGRLCGDWLTRDCFWRGEVEFNNRHFK